MLCGFGKRSQSTEKQDRDEAVDHTPRLIFEARFGRVVIAVGLETSIEGGLLARDRAVWLGSWHWLQRHSLGQLRVV